MTSITITNPSVIDFFNKNPTFEPENFMLQLISNFEINKQKKNENTSNADKIEVNKDELLQFYEEYQFYLSQKKNLSQLTREFNMNFKRNINRIKFKKLDDFLSKHLNVKCQTYICRICNTYNVSTKKGLITHERICRNKNISINNDIGSHDDEDDMENSDGIESDEDGDDVVSVEVENLVPPTPPPQLNTKPVVVVAKKGNK